MLSQLLGGYIRLVFKRSSFVVPMGITWLIVVLFMIHIIIFFAVVVVSLVVSFGAYDMDVAPDVLESTEHHLLLLILLVWWAWKSLQGCFCNNLLYSKIAVLSSASLSITACVSIEALC